MCLYLKSYMCGINIGLDAQFGCLPLVQPSGVLWYANGFRWLKMCMSIHEGFM